MEIYEIPFILIFKDFQGCHVKRIVCLPYFVGVTMQIKGVVILKWSLVRYEIIFRLQVMQTEVLVANRFKQVISKYTYMTIKKC